MQQGRGVIVAAAGAAQRKLNTHRGHEGSSGAVLALKIYHVHEHAWHEGTAGEQVHIECRCAPLSVGWLAVWPAVQEWK